MTICMAVTHTVEDGTTFVSLSDTQITVEGESQNPLPISINVTGVTSPAYNGAAYSQVDLALKTILINPQMVLLMSGSVAAAARLKRQIKMEFGRHPERNNQIGAWLQSNFKNLGKAIDFNSISFMIYFIHAGQTGSISHRAAARYDRDFRVEVIGSGSTLSSALFETGSSPWNVIPGSRGIPSDIDRVMGRIIEGCARAFLNEVTGEGLLHKACNGITEVALTTSENCFRKINGIQNLFVAVEMEGSEVTMNLRAFNSLRYKVADGIDEEYADLVLGRKTPFGQSGAQRRNVYELGSVLTEHPLKSDGPMFDHAFEIVNVCGMIKIDDTVMRPFWFADPRLSVGVEYGQDGFDMTSEVSRSIQEMILGDQRFFRANAGHAMARSVGS